LKFSVFIPGITEQIFKSLLSPKQFYKTMFGKDFESVNPLKISIKNSANVLTALFIGAIKY